MIIPSNVHIDDVKRALNHSSNDVGTLCITSNVKQWASYKPFHFAGEDPSTTVRDGRQGSGFEYDAGSRSPFTYYTLRYIKPKGGSGSPFRIGDFRGYNSDALTPSIKKLNYNYPANQTVNDVIVAPSDSVGYGKFHVAFPDIAPYKLPLSPLQDSINKVAIVDYVNNGKHTIWSLNFDQSLTTGKLNYENYKNSEIVADVEVRNGLPAVGQTATRNFYLEIGGFEVGSIQAKIAREWRQDPGSDLQYKPCSRTEVSNNSILSYFDFSNSTMQYLLRYESADRSIIRLNNLKVKSTQASWMIDIYVQHATSSDWVQVCRFSRNGASAANFTLYNGASFYSAPKYTPVADASASFSIDTKIELSNKSLREYNVRIVGSLDNS